MTTQRGRLTRTYSVFIMALVRNRRKLMVISAVVTTLGLAGLARFRIETDLGRFYPGDDPTSLLTARLYGDTPIPRLLTVVFRADDARLLDKALPAIVEALEGSPYLQRVLATREHWFGERVQWALQAPLHFISDESRDRLKERLAGSDRMPALKASLRQIAEDPLAGKEVVLRDPLRLRWLLEEAGDPKMGGILDRLLKGSPYVLFEQPPLAIVRVIGRQDWMDVNFSEALLADLNPRIAGAVGSRPIHFDMVGGYATASFHSHQVKKDLLVQSVSSMVLVLLFLVFFTRGIRVPVLIVLGMGVSTMCTLSFGGMLLGPLNPLTVSLAAILIAQGVEFPIRFYTRYRRERQWGPQETAFENTHVSIGKLQIGAAATSIVAFLALLLSRFPGIREFAVLLSFGLVLCLLASLTVLPLLIIRTDRRSEPPAEKVPVVVRIARAIAFSGARLPAAAVVLLATAGAWGLVAWKGTRFDLDPRRMAPPGDPGERVVARLEKDLSVSLFPVFVLVDESTPFAKMRDGCERLRAGGRAAHFDGPHLLFPGPEMHEKVEEFRRRTRGWVEATLADLASLGFKPEPFRKGLEELGGRLAADPPGMAALTSGRFAGLARSMTFEDHGHRFWVLHLYPGRALFDNGERAAFDRAVRLELGPDVRLLSDGHMTDYYSDLLRKDLLIISVISGGAVLLVSFLMVGSFKAGILSILPVVTATGVTLASSILFVGPLNLINMIAVPMVIGLAVHDGTYYAGHLRGHRYRGPEEAMLDVGPGIWGSAATTILGFAAIATSVSPGLVSMGILVAVGRAAAMVATLILLPALWGGEKIVEIDR
jgi:predicted RND superfamily exporter protein